MSAADLFLITSICLVAADASLLFSASKQDGGVVKATQLSKMKHVVEGHKGIYLRLMEGQNKAKL